MKNIIVFGAASGGRIIADAITQQKGKFKLLCFLDNDDGLWGSEIGGVEVLGGVEELPQLLAQNEVHELIVAVSNIDQETLSILSLTCNANLVELKVIPDSLNIVLDDPILNQVRDVDVIDLLGRKEVYIRSDFINEWVSGSIIAITGAAGSIGSELVKQICKFSPSKIIAIDINENDLYLLDLFVSRHYPNIDFVSSICSIQDYSSIESEFRREKPCMVFHCAAHKHVPLMERAPMQAIKNNVYGTYNVAKAAKKCLVGRFVLISTDKAVNPTNVMGASKRLAELLILSLNEDDPNTRFMVVRFGNVLGSAGSVIPIFKELLKEGKDLTVTDERMTRYFMTIPEAARLVIEAGFTGSGGELFVLDMGEPVKIQDLAKNMIALSGANVGINYVGLRPGEKLYEELFYDNDSVVATKNEKILISMSEASVNISMEDILEKLDKVIMFNADAKQFLLDVVPTYRPDL